MRLLNVHTLEFKDFHEDRTPPYAVTSHRWGSDEASYKDVLKGKNQQSEGYIKIQNFCSFVRRHCRENQNEPKLIDWVWIDTCCINQNSSAEVSESINSMWRWYSKATHCIAYLRDVRPFTDAAFKSDGGREGVLFDLRNSEWFERGWTLQELLAPPCVVFVTQNWEIIGRKSPADHTCPMATGVLNALLAEVTGIPRDVLCGFESHRDSIGKEIKMSWAANRQTTKPEDVAYCLLGIFDVHIAMIYGEGQRHARRRLELEIRNREREEQEFGRGEAVPRHQAPSVGEGKSVQPDHAGPQQLTREVVMADKTLSCPVCHKILNEPVTTSCRHTYCETCLKPNAEGDLMLLFESLSSQGTAQGDAAVQNFGTKWQCSVCRAPAYVWHNGLRAQQLRAAFPLQYADRAAEISQSLEDCEILDISIGNYHELVGINAHRWTFFLRPNRTDIIEEVYIQLHDSFEHPERCLPKPPYTLHGQGWGYFRIRVAMILKAGYMWECNRSKAGPSGAPNQRLDLEWTLDFESHKGRGSKGRCRIQYRKNKHSSG